MAKQMTGGMKAGSRLLQTLKILTMAGKKKKKVTVTAQIRKESMISITMRTIMIVMFLTACMRCSHRPIGRRILASKADVDLLMMTSLLR